MVKLAKFVRRYQKITIRKLLFPVLLVIKLIDEGFKFIR